MLIPNGTGYGKALRAINGNPIASIIEKGSMQTINSGLAPEGLTKLSEEEFYGTERHSNCAGQCESMGWKSKK